MTEESRRKIEALSKANNWTPTKVRLPEEHGFYLVTARYSAKQVEVLRVNWAGEWCYFPGVKITAWQPMPDPYTGEE